jgi:aspartate kinase
VTAPPIFPSPSIATTTARRSAFCEGVKEKIGARDINGDNTTCKVSAVGVGMRSHPGVASKMFGALAKENINLQMISTSEIKISVVIEEKYLELAVRVLHKAFGLEKPPKSKLGLTGRGETDIITPS